MSKKPLTKMQIVACAFYGVLLAFAAICFIMAMVIGLSRPAVAATAEEYAYKINLKAPMETVKITPAVCENVRQLGGIIKTFIDNGYGDKTIIDILSKAAIDNPQDRNGWIAYHIVTGDNVLSTMREWPKEDLYIWMTVQFPDLTDRQYYTLYAAGRCDSALGKTQKVVKVDKIPVVKGAHL